MKNRKTALLLVCFFLTISSTAFALAPTDAMGEWRLTSFSINYPAYGLNYTQADASSYSGRLSISRTSFVMENEALIDGTYAFSNGVGFYTISGNTVTITLPGIGAQVVTVTMGGPNQLTVKGSNYDLEGDFYQFTFNFNRTDTYYDANQVTQAVNEATAGLFTQSQVDAAIATALSSVKPKVVPIILSD